MLRGWCTLLLPKVYRHRWLFRCGIQRSKRWEAWNGLRNHYFAYMVMESCHDRSRAYNPVSFTRNTCVKTLFFATDKSPWRVVWTTFWFAVCTAESGGRARTMPYHEYSTPLRTHIHKLATKWHKLHTGDRWRTCNCFEQSDRPSTRQSDCGPKNPSMSVFQWLRRFMCVCMCARGT